MSGVAEKLPWMQAVQRGLWQKQLGFIYGFSAYTKKKKKLLRRHSKKIMLLGSLHRELLGYPCPCNSTA